jgi:hypothetical protein
MAEKVTRAYPADMSSLDALKLVCEADEANLLAELVSLQLGTDNEAKVTIGVYEVASGLRFGHLALDEYKADVDEQSLKAIHQSKGDTFLFKGAAYIQNNPVTLLAFGGHGPGDHP